MFTEYKFSKSQINMATVQAARQLSQSSPGSNPAAFAARVMGDRLKLDPTTYLQFGPYWWAVKVALAQLGHDLGAYDDVAVRLEYGAAFSVYGGLVAGEQFRDFYLASFLAGTAVFALGEEGGYRLFDPDMDARRLGAAVAEVVAHEEAMPEAIVLDSIEPPAGAFTVPFKFNEEDWTAELLAASLEAAHERIQLLDSAGDLAEAIGFAQEVGESTVSTEDYDRPLLVDLAGRRLVEVA